MRGAVSGRGKGRRAGMSVGALSRLTWTVEDRRAWNETYRASLLVACRGETLQRNYENAVRRAARARAVVVAGDHSVHASILEAREVEAVLRNAL